MVLLAIPQWLRAGGRGGHLTRIVLAGILCLLMVAASPLAAAGAGFPSLTGPSSQAANAQTSSLISSTSFPPGSPSARWGMALTFDASAGGVLVFSGAGGSNDTWLFSNGTWTELHTPDAPSARARASLAYDNATGQALLFGGESGTTDQNDTWVFSGGSWTRAVTPTAPSPRYGASLTYDAETGYFLLFGGLDGHTFLNDTWKFQGGRWTNITATLGTSPPARFAADLAFDPALGEAVLFGGVGVSPLTHRNQTLSDTWTYSPSGWVKLHLAHHPPSRWFADLAPEPSQDGLLLFGGLGGSTRNDTWVFANDTWSELSPARSPPARFLAGMAYDPAIHADVLFGGLSSNQPHVPILGDTWPTFRTGGVGNRLICPWAEFTPCSPSRGLR
jgi:hypothetical protein